MMVTAVQFVSDAALQVHLLLLPELHLHLLVPGVVLADAVSCDEVAADVGQLRVLLPRFLDQTGKKTHQGRLQPVELNIQLVMVTQYSSCWTTEALEVAVSHSRIQHSGLQGDGLNTERNQKQAATFCSSLTDWKLAVGHQSLWPVAQQPELQPHSKKVPAAWDLPVWSSYVQGGPKPSILTSAADNSIVWFFFADETHWNSRWQPD